jgi:RHS repeat-associated protein
MQLGSDTRIPDGLLAAITLLREKPHQGVPSSNPAPHQGIDEHNSTAALGLRASAALNRVWPRYTGKERDTESGNDYMFARYYNSATGRFLSPDWSAKIQPVPYGKLDNPQSLNLYQYMRNNPMAGVDPDGHCGGPGEAPCPSEDDLIVPNSQQQLSSDVHGAASPAAEDFSKIGDTNANNDHINYSVSTGEIAQYTSVNGDLPDVKSLGTGYSGKGAGLNNPSMESVPGAVGKSDAGPIPEGTYAIGKQQDNVTGSGTKLVDSMRLTPDAGNDMHGRAGFLMHGDNKAHNHSASEGCIVVPDKKQRDAVGGSGDKTLTVTE